MCCGTALQNIVDRFLHLGAVTKTCLGRVQSIAQLEEFLLCPIDGTRPSDRVPLGFARAVEPQQAKPLAACHVIAAHSQTIDDLVLVIEHVVQVFPGHAIGILDESRSKLAVFASCAW